MPNGQHHAGMLVFTSALDNVFLSLAIFGYIYCLAVGGFCTLVSREEGPKLGGFTRFNIRRSYKYKTVSVKVDQMS